MSAKIITMHNPIPKTGQTTVANLLGMSLAEKEKFVLLIEMSECTGYSVILNKSIDRVFSSLKSALLLPNKTQNNILKSIYNPNFYFLANNYENTIKDLKDINITSIDKVVKQVSNTFDYIIIDLPSNPYDESTKYLLSKSMLAINHHIEVIDENVMSVKLLNECGNIFSEIQRDNNIKINTTLVVNKSMGRYSKLYEGHLRNIPFYNILNIVNIPYIQEYTYVCNEGNMLSIGKTAESRELKSSIQLLKKIIQKNADSVGMITTRNVSENEIKKKSKTSLFNFSKSDKSNKKTNQKEIKKPKTVNKKEETVNIDIEETTKKVKNKPVKKKSGLFIKKKDKNIDNKEISDNIEIETIEE